MTFSRAKFGTYFIASLLAGASLYFSGHNGNQLIRIDDCLELTEGFHERCRPKMSYWPDVHTQKVVSSVYIPLTTNYTTYYQDGKPYQTPYIVTNAFVTNVFVYTNWTDGFHWASPTKWSIGRETNAVVAYTNGPDYDALTINVVFMFQQMAYKWRMLVPNYVDDYQFGSGTTWYENNPLSNAPPMMTVSNIFDRYSIGNKKDKFAFETNSVTPIQITRNDFLEMYKAVKALKWTAKTLSWNRYIRYDPSYAVTVDSKNKSQVNGQLYPNHSGYFTVDDLSDWHTKLIDKLVDNFADELINNSISWRAALTNNSVAPYVVLSGGASLLKESWETASQYDVGLGWTHDVHYYTNREYRTSASVPSGSKAKTESIYVKFPSEVPVQVQWYAFTETNSSTRLSWEVFSDYYLSGSDTIKTSSFCMFPSGEPSSIVVKWDRGTSFDDAKANFIYDTQHSPFPYMASVGTNKTSSTNFNFGTLDKVLLPAIEKWQFTRCVN